MSDVEDAPRRVQVQLSLERIYLKDASFESPGTPTIFLEEFRPEMQVDINTGVNSLGDSRHEVVLTVTVTAKRKESLVAYIAEVHEAGIFFIEGVDGEALRQVLGKPVGMEEVEDRVVEAFGEVFGFRMEDPSREVG